MSRSFASVLALGIVGTAAAPLTLPAGEESLAYGAIDFRCPAGDESSPQMIANNQDSECCCRVRCHQHSRWSTSFRSSESCNNAKQLCRRLPLCFALAVSGDAEWATLKAKPRWWLQAPGVDECRRIHVQGAEGKAAARAAAKAWMAAKCNDYVHGEPAVARRRGRFVFDIGFHTGDDTLFFLSQGFDVVAVEANHVLISEGMRRPSIALAARSEQLHLVNAGIVRNEHNRTLTFYVHKTVSAWSTFMDSASKRLDQFTPLQVPTVTCAALIRKYGVPLYPKIDIEGADKWCIHSLTSLRKQQLPRYISTEDPLALDAFVRLGYTRFKMVDQSLARRGGVSFSGGMPEGAPSRNPKWAGGATGDLNHTSWPRSEAKKYP
ncbi:hypothetical protein EMIHUDRAFT_216728 [Emiliania huxleyi CCMP1516]|uniref:Methyltransferase FkbM domain-containing protein n=2 Tax=Emiliania huxleyi TaxID=2903 RepID=A0A0D3IDI8_EMIH1|nr:hypothetical protein EMIHUDRAFT_216728 [Emiliania huxleyi CCMP1516]EOD09323.1 hypothetical protein EMIHUDRAFT_216728 [Emiliania huxleyi CCMP1516]|eukprot:XP_005761752.1 hypothetical protein EMIHUDRAFT_216728 [Emiliania huxleyi CCMP1516]